MFESFPGFEELPIHLEVEHQGRKRPLVVRIEQLPNSPPLALPVCSWLDAPDEGEWILGAGQSGIRIHTFGNPRNLLQIRNVFRGAGQPTEPKIELNSARFKKFQGHIERALDEKVWAVYVVRLVQLSCFSSPPYIALLTPYKSYWYLNRESNGTASFAVAETDVLRLNSTAHDWLQTQWDDPDSDARFAWEWASWSAEECIAKSCSIQSGNHEVEQVMRWLLLSMPSLWACSTECTWRLDWEEEEHGYVDTDSDFGNGDELLAWQKWLWAHFFSRWHADWMERHSCVQDFWRYRPVARVEIEISPTMHEQLEARLELRDWLEGKATPDEIERLLAVDGLPQ